MRATVVEIRILARRFGLNGGFPGGHSRSRRIPLKYLNFLKDYILYIRNKCFT
jgi:hypothetical protein